MDILNRFYIFASVLQVVDICIRLLRLLARRVEARKDQRNPEDRQLISYQVSKIILRVYSSLIRLSC
jgi:hypothetical protein